MDRPSQEVRAPIHEVRTGARQTLGARRTKMRVLHRKSQGIVAVYEQDPSSANAGARTLVFESPVACTRLTEFPAEWHRLSDEELAALRRSQS